MINDKDTDLTSGIEQLRTGLYRVVDDAILNIARTCAGVSPDVLDQIIESVSSSLQDVIAQNVAVATPAMVTDAPSPKNVAKKPGRKADWSQSSDASLRQVYRKRIISGKDIEPELEAELLRFPTYDATTHKFTGRRKPNTQAAAPFAEHHVVRPQVKMKYWQWPN